MSSIIDNSQNLTCVISDSTVGLDTKQMEYTYEFLRAQLFEDFYVYKKGRQ